jgi:phage gp36-like protein
MSYASLDILTDRYGENMLVMLTDRTDVPTGMIDEDVVNRALSDTDAVIDGYLAARYALPVADVPPLLADLAQAIAIYKLHRTATDPKIEEDYKQALKTLEQIATGKVRLPIDGVEPSGSGDTGVRITDRERPLTAANMKGFI